MIGRSKQIWIVVGATCLSMVGAASRAGAEVVDPIPVGIVTSFFQDAPPQKQGALVEPLRTLIRVQTGLTSDIQFSEHFMQLAKGLAEGKVKLGVLQGVELAWAKERYPELRTLMVLVNKLPFQQVHLVVRDNSGAKGFADLQGKKLAMGRSTRLHQKLYLERNCQELCQCRPDRYFSGLARPAIAEDGLDDLVDGIHDAMVVDRVAWESYQRRKPARAQRLKVLQSSEVFPATAVAYRPGQVSPEQLQQFKEGLLGANKNIMGRQLLSLWHLSGFASVPTDYDKTLTEIVKAYPPPANPTSAKSAEERAK